MPAALMGQVEPREDGLAATVPDSWLQGRTAYGGLSTALAYAAARGLADDLPPLRSAQISFIGPLAARLEAKARMIRRGRSTAFAEASVSGESGVGLGATFLFVASRDSALRHEGEPAPVSIPPEEAHPAMRGDRAPGFAGNFDYRHALPERTEPVPDLLFWVRLRARDQLDTVSELLLLADALPPAAMPLMTVRAPISSMTWLINLLSPAPATRDGWWLLRSTAQYVAGGFSSQSMAIWNRNGEPVATGMQSVALFG